MATTTNEGIERFTRKREELEIDKLFRAVVKLEGSDLHLKVDKPPFVRVRGSLRPMSRGPVSDEEMARLCFPMLDERNRRIFEENGGADFAYTCECDGILWRFRVNLLQQLGHLGLVARRVNNKIPSFDKLYLPAVIESLCKF